jgi:hypothetical protein
MYSKIFTQTTSNEAPAAALFGKSRHTNVAAHLPELR